jgi:hypothetical protein
MSDREAPTAVCDETWVDHPQGKMFARIWTPADSATGRGTEALITMSAQAFPEERTLQGIRVAKAQFDNDGQVERLKRYHGDKARWVLDAWIETWLHPELIISMVSEFLASTRQKQVSA